MNGWDVTEEQAQELLKTHSEDTSHNHAGKQLPDPPWYTAAIPNPPKKPSKYHNERTPYNGVNYDSLKEATHAQENDLRIKAGDLSYYLYHIPIRLPGKVVYELDFMEFSQVVNTPLYEVHFVEVKPDTKPGKKAFRIRAGEDKRKIAEAVLGVKIEVV